MAFISGYNVKYKCKLCDGYVKRELDASGGIGMLGYRLNHSTCEVIMVNGYPSPCGNNSKLLEQDQVREVKEPIIDSDWRTMSY